jgi:hypothetical protein
MATFIQFINFLNDKSTSIEVDSEKRTTYEKIIQRFIYDDTVNGLVITSIYGDEYYLTKQFAQNFMIRIQTKY